MAVTLATNPYAAHKGLSFNEDDVRAQRHHAADPPTKGHQYSAASVGAVLPTIALSAPTTHYEREVLVHVRQFDREEVLQPLGVALTSGTINTARCISIRLTDPRDPFFLYCMTLSENDFGRFKESHELHVDWNGFPQSIINMFEGRFQQQTAEASSAGDADRSTLSAAVHSNRGLLRFHAHNNGQGTFRVLQPTDFRMIEHISLTMTQQGDVGQKQYLAERFKFYEAEYFACAQARAHERAVAETRIDELSREVTALEVQLTGMKQRLEQDLSTAELKRVDEVSRLKEVHAAEIQRLQATYQSERSSLDARVEAANASLHLQLSDVRNQLETTLRQLADAEVAKKELSRDLADSAQTHKAIAEERRRLEEENKVLHEIQTQLTKEKAQWELRDATMSVHLSHYESSNAQRSLEVTNMRSQIDILTRDTEQLKQELSKEKAKSASLEATLNKARAAFNGQQQQLAAANDKIKTLSAQVSTTDALVNERNLAVERAKQETSNVAERLELANAKIDDLKKSLADSEATREKLTQQLKQSEDALIHSQRVSNGSGLRFSHTSSLQPPAVPLASTYTPRVPTSYVPPSAVASIPSYTHGTAPPSSVGARSTAGLFKDFSLGAGAPVSVPSVSQTTSFAAQQQNPVARREFDVKLFADHEHTLGNTSVSAQENNMMFGATAKSAVPKVSTAAPVPTSIYFPSLSS